MSIVCFQWGNANSSWINGDWMWPECSSSIEPTTSCSVWNTEIKHWDLATWDWDACPQDVCSIWNDEVEDWDLAAWNWDECSGSIPPIPPVVTSSFVQPPGVDATTLVQPWLIEPWNPYTANDAHDKKRKRLIKLICKVNGKTYEEEKEVGTMNVSVDDVKMVIKKAINIDIKLEE